jgi:DNA helicase-2/ATP-dependent DNA helicase PcrA
LFYVAATRAKQLLFLTAADDYGGKKLKKISQFVMEMLDEPSSEKLKHKLSPLEKIERFQKIEKEVNTKAPKPKEGTIKLSRQQIDDYFTCPKKYYYAQIVKIPLLENHNLMYGTAIHSALDHYFARKIRKENPSLSQLIADFDQAFRNVGFITREHEEQRHKAGIETLTKFYDFDQKEGRAPTGVETSFEFMENDVRINGRYDLIYGDDHPEIWDFKTSAVKNQKDADSRIKKSTQMQIYALSWFEKYKTIPKTTLYFIESGFSGSKVFTIKELMDTKKLIFDVAAGIRNNDFQASPDRRNCDLCPYKDICPEAIN